jgi:light-independent protochlorophyllide reductase subunit B
LPSYQKKENWGAAETLYQLVRAAASGAAPPAGFKRPPRAPGDAPSCNILGPTALGFRHRDDLRAVQEILAQLGVRVNVVAPLGATFADLARLGEADFNVLLYPETGAQAARWLERIFDQPSVKTVPIGLRATREFITEVARAAGIDPAPHLQSITSRSEWYSRSVDSTYLTGKRVVVFGDATHAAAAARVAAEELGFSVVGLGTYSREFAREIREAAARYGVEAFITDDYLEVEAKIAELQPDLVLGTQMERHIAKRLRTPCAVISSPVHVQDFPARYSPQMGFEGANVIFDTWVHPLMMGLEEHLLTMFRGDFEFNDAAPASHLGAQHAVPAGATPAIAVQAPVAQESAAAQAPSVAQLPAAAQAPAAAQPLAAETTPSWAPEAEKELGKIPFFVRGKARRNAERFAVERSLGLITLETLYDAKAHFSR